MKLYSPSYDKDPFGMFDEVIKYKKVTDIKADGCLILWGGEDNFPGIYGQTANRYVNQFYMSNRDRNEMDAINHCIKYNIPMIGICRGAQLMCCMAGGKLMQHIPGHGFSHELTLLDEGNATIRCNSSHHQMMLPPNSAKILAVHEEPVVGVGEQNKTEYLKQVNEVVWFPTILALGIQPHPEWDNSPTTFNDYCKRKIKEYIL